MTTQSASLAVDATLEKELIDLRRDLLAILVPTVSLLGCLWFSYVVIRGWPLLQATCALLLLIAGSYGAHRLDPTHHYFACAALLASMMLAQIFLVATPQVRSAMAFGTLVVIVTAGLASKPIALSLTLLMWMLNVLVLRLVSNVPVTLDVHTDILLIYLLTLGACWIVLRPLRLSVSWALAGWNQAHAALEEVRDRRAELYRALRALEEATYRIERMNNELIVAQQEAEQARAMKERFVAMVTHELRGPLNLILGFSRLVALSPESYGEALPDPYRTDVYAIYRNTQHLVALVDDILDLSQVDVRKLPLVKDRVDIVSDVLDHCVRTVKPLVERKGLYLRQEIVGNLSNIIADPVRLRQALLNLLTNAVRFTENGGITVMAALHDGDIRISVADTGTGIAAEHIPKLFKPFYQVQRTETRESRGSGLGLSITKHLIELHGGRIEVESHPGRGTTFHIYLPLTGAMLPDQVSDEDSLGTDRAISYQSCLIVHSDLLIVRMLARHLEDYHVVGLPDGREVISLTKQLHPRAIITTPDLALYVEQQLKDANLSVPVISLALPRAEETSLEGVLGYLIKPIMPEALTSIMRKVEKDDDTEILLVEDDPDAMRLMERMLLSLPRPYRIRRAYDGEEALNQLADAIPDVVFMDLMMPGMDGFEALARMQADSRFHDIPVVIVSARTLAEDRIRLHGPITAHYDAALDIGQVADCLRTLLMVLKPRYPMEAKASELGANRMHCSRRRSSAENPYSEDDAEPS